MLVECELVCGRMPFTMKAHLARLGVWFFTPAVRKFDQTFSFFVPEGTQILRSTRTPRAGVTHKLCAFRCKKKKSLVKFAHSKRECVVLRLIMLARLATLNQTIAPSWWKPMFVILQTA